MDLKLRFEKFFGTNEETNNLWLELNSFYSDELSSFHNWEFVSLCLQRMDAEVFSGVDLAVLEAAVWVGPHKSSNLINILPAGANEIIEGHQSPESDIFKDIQSTYFL